MRKLNCIILVSFVVALVSCVRNLAPQASFQPVPVVADGYANEWQLPLKYFNKTYKFSYYITNDTKNIYFVAAVTDWRMVRRVLKEGLTIYFDPKGGSGTKTSLTYPSRKTDLGYLLKGVDSVTYLNTLVLQSDIYDAEGFVNIENGPHEVLDKDSRIRIGMHATVDSGLVYEAIVPIENILAKGLTAKSLKRNFSVGVVIHADESWRQVAPNGVKNNDNTASAFQNDNNHGSGGGSFGGIKDGGALLDGPRQNFRKGVHEVEETMWNEFSFATGK